MPHCWRSLRSARFGRGAGAGALLPNTAYVVIEVLESEKRPVAAVADHDEARDVRPRRGACPTSTISMRMLFDPGHSLEERILSEQFSY